MWIPSSMSLSLSLGSSSRLSFNWAFFICLSSFFSCWAASPLTGSLFASLMVGIRAAAWAPASWICPNPPPEKNSLNADAENLRISSQSFVCLLYETDVTEKKKRNNHLIQIETRVHSRIDVDRHFEPLFVGAVGQLDHEILRTHERATLQLCRFIFGHPLQ